MIINNIEYLPHGCWSTATSKANNTDVNIDEINVRCCWKNKQKSFKFHDENIPEFAPVDIEFKDALKVFHDFKNKQQKCMK